MRHISKYKWSSASMGLSIGLALLTYAIVVYMQGQGQWMPGSKLDQLLGLVNIGTVASSFLLAVIALFKEPTLWYGLLALVLSLVGLFSYAR
jgi:hypothetical protein